MNEVVGFEDCNLKKMRALPFVNSKIWGRSERGDEVPRLGFKESRQGLRRAG